MERLLSFWRARGRFGKAVIILAALIIIGNIGSLVSGGKEEQAPTATTQAIAQATTETTRAITTTTTAPATTTTIEPPTTTTTEDPAARRAAYIQITESVEYRKLEKSPDRYIGKPLRFTGEVVQIVEDSTGTIVRLAVTKTDWGYDYDSIVWLWYPGPMEDVYEEDIIRVWGEGNGSQSYMSQAGWEITIPAIIAEYWEKVQ